MLSVSNIRPPRSYCTQRSPYTQLLYTPIALHTVTVHTDRPTHSYCTHRSPYTQLLHTPIALHTVTVHTGRPTLSYCTHRSPYIQLLYTPVALHTITVHTDRPTHSYCTNRYILVPVACIWYHIMSIISISGTVLLKSLITDRFKMSNRSLSKLLRPLVTSLLTYSTEQSFLRS